MLLSVGLVCFLLAPPTCSLPVYLSPRDVRAPRRKLNPTFKPEYGRIVGPGHVVLKVDCPDCPLEEVVSNDNWNQKDATLIYDLVIPETTSQQLLWKVEKPQRSGRYAHFFPPGPSIGATPFAPSINIIGRSSLTVDEYLTGDSTTFPLEVPGIVEAVSIPNRFDWNITRVSYINGLCYANGSDQSDLSDIPVAHVYLLHHTTGQLEIVWWEIQDVYDFRIDTSEPNMPPLLERELRRGSRDIRGGRAWLQPQYDCKTLSDQMARWLVFGVLVVVLLIIGAYLEGQAVHGGSEGGLSNCEDGKPDWGSCIHEESVDEELLERLERHP